MQNLRMPELNEVTIAGNMTKDPEGRDAGSSYVCTFSMAMTRRYKTKAGEKCEEVVFINVECWGKTAQYVAHNFLKGDPVLVRGRLKMNEWNDKTTGQKRTSIEVSAERVMAMSWRDDGATKSTPDEPSFAGNQDDIPF